MTGFHLVDSTNTGTENKVPFLRNLFNKLFQKKL